MKCTFRFIALILGLAVALSANAEIYQWKDKDGKMYYSDRPPPNQPGIQQKQAPKQVQQPASEPAQDEDEDEADGAEPKKAATVAPVQKKSLAEQRDEESRKRRAAAEAREKEEKAAARATQNCERARTQYAALNSGQRIARLSETGERKFLNDEEKAAEIAHTKELMDAFCGKD